MLEIFKPDIPLIATAISYNPCNTGKGGPDNMISSRIILECFHQHIFVGVFDASRPIEPEVSRLFAGGFCEVTGQFGPTL